MGKTTGLMEKRLILFRHGKSDWNGDFECDHERPLAKRGVKAAKTMGRLLAASGQIPDLIITSSAVRAHSTVDLAGKEGRWNCSVQVTDSLYAASPAQVLEQVKQTPDPISTLLLAGHEPTWSQLTSLLVGGGRISFPTAAMARIDFEIDAWNQVEYGQGTLIWLLQPRFFTQ